MEGETKNNGLRCRPGDLAKIKSAWNQLLVGKLVVVRRSYSESEWVVRLLDLPALAISEDRKGHVITKTIIAGDWALEPLRDVPLQAECFMNEGAQADPHRHPFF